MKVNAKFYWKYWRFLAVLTILSIIVYCWGWHASKPNDGMPFARAGAVATAILITFLVSDYAEKLGQLARDVQDRITIQMNLTEASESIQQKLVADINKLADRTKIVIRYWYAALMFFATIVWGSGIAFTYWLCMTQCLRCTRSLQN